MSSIHQQGTPHMVDEFDQLIASENGDEDSYISSGEESVDGGSDDDEKSREEESSENAPPTFTILQTLREAHRNTSTQQQITNNLTFTNLADTEAIVSVKVRDITLKLPADKLCQLSEFFKVSLLGGWRETHEQHIELKGSMIRPQSWKLFIIYLRDGTFGQQSQDILLNPSLTTEEQHEYSSQDHQLFSRVGKNGIETGKVDLVIDRLLHAYLLGDYLRAPDFCNYIVDRLLESYGEFTSIHQAVPLWNLRLVYKAIPNSGLRRMVMDFLTYFLSAETLEEAVDRGLIKRKNLLELMKGMLRDRALPMGLGGLMPYEEARWKICEYHDHEKGAYEAPCRKDDGAWGSSEIGPYPGLLSFGPSGAETRGWDIVGERIGGVE